MSFDWNDFIEIDPEVLVGKPVIKGTRIAVEFVLEMLASGVSEAEILANYPRLKRKDILACVAYAAEVIKSERAFPLTA